MFEEIRSWLTLGLALIVSFITLNTFINGQKQRKLENSFRMIELFKEHVSKKDIEVWENIFFGVAQAKPGFYMIWEDNESDIQKKDYGQGEFIEVELAELFDFTSLDGGSIRRMAEFFDLVSEQALLGSLDLRLIYFEFGQLMDSIHSWLGFSSENYSFLKIKELYPSLNMIYQKGLLKPNWKKKIYVQIC